MRLRARLGEETPLGMLALLADVERRDGPVVAHHARPHFAALALVVGDLLTPETAHTLRGPWSTVMHD